MTDHSGSKKGLGSEVQALRKQVRDLKEAAVERRRVEDALRVSDTLHHGTLEDAPVGVVRLSPAGKVLFTNPAFIRALGYSSRQDFHIIGSLRGVFADDEESRRVVQLALGACDATITARCRHRDGGEVVFRLRGGGVSREGVTLIHSGEPGESSPE
jgi:PAS domain-containing protein